MNLTIALDPKNPKPLQHQLCEAIRQLILKGRLSPGQRLPSTRELAASLSISRNTVIASYEQLKSEGYLETVASSGAFVCLRLPEALLQPEHSQIMVNSATLATPCQPLSAYGASLMDTEPFAPPVPDAPINFRYARPAFDQTPLQQWKKLWARHCRFADAAVLDYAPDSLGYPPLRAAIADYLARSRSVQCEADQVIIVNGSVQTANLIARILLERGDWAAVDGAHLTVRFHSCLSDNAIIRQAAQVGVGLGSTSPYYVGGGHPGEFLLGYAALPENQIRQGINRLAKILKSQSE